MAIINGEISLIKASALFDVDYYLGQVGFALLADLDPIRHYLMWGWKQGHEPSRLFDSKQYLRKYGHLLDKATCPLIDYLSGWKQHHRNPSILFDTEYYLNQSTQSVFSDPVTDYLKRRNFEISPHPCFDPSFYLSQNVDVATNDLNPWQHFMLFGRFEGRQPHPMFDFKHYRAQLLDIAVEYNSCLEHFIEEGWRDNLSPHPSFSMQHYRSLFPTLSVNPLEHFEKLCQSANASDSESLSAAFCREAIKLKESANGQILATEAFNLAFKIDGENKFQKVKESTKPIVLFLGHEATRTGAPLILLELIRHFSEAGFECGLVLVSGGPIVSEYEKYATVQVLLPDLPPIFQIGKYIEHIQPFIAENRIVAAVVNTSALAGVHDGYKANGIHTITLVHEFVDGVAESNIEKLYNGTDQIVFPSQFIKDICDKRLPLGDIPAHVKAQGILKPDFGGLDKELARKALREELQIPEDSFIVLGVGPIDLRKGFDLFLRSAQIVLQHKSSEKPIHFVWLGADIPLTYSLHYFSLWDIRQAGLEWQFHIVQNTPDNEKFFVGADVFFMSSRQDPYPCVVQESLACALPVVAFSGAGGAREMLQNGGGITCPYGDLDAVSKAILHYWHNEDKRVMDGSRGRLTADGMKFEEYFEFIRGLIPEKIQSEDLISILPYEHSESVFALSKS